MFRSQPGCLGVLVTRSGNECLTISLWENQDYVGRLGSSPTYNKTVREIEASGVLEGAQSVELLESFGGFLEVTAVAEALGV